MSSVKPSGKVAAGGGSSSFEGAFLGAMVTIYFALVIFFNVGMFRLEKLKIQGSGYGSDNIP